MVMIKKLIIYIRELMNLISIERFIGNVTIIMINVNSPMIYLKLMLKGLIIKETIKMTMKRNYHQIRKKTTKKIKALIKQTTIKINLKLMQKEQIIIEK